MFWSNPENVDDALFQNSQFYSNTPKNKFKVKQSQRRDAVETAACKQIEHFQQHV